MVTARQCDSCMASAEGQTLWERRGMWPRQLCSSVFSTALLISLACSCHTYPGRTVYLVALSSMPPLHPIVSLSPGRIPLTLPRRMPWQHHVGIDKRHETESPRRRWWVTGIQACDTCPWLLSPLPWPDAARIGGLNCLLGCQLACNKSPGKMHTAFERRVSKPSM